MRIATLTWFTGNNYGSTMQAYAMQTVLKKLGHETEILAYKPGKAKNLLLKVKNHSLKATVDYKINELYLKIKSGGSDTSWNNMQLFDTFRDKYMKFSAPLSSENQLRLAAEAYDVLICGSDQIWSPFYFDPTYALNFCPDKKKIAYAPSFGVTQLPDRSKKRMAELIGRIPYLSVREAAGAELVRELIGKPARMVADPVLFLSRQEWQAIAADVPEEKPYILCYFLRKNEQYHRFVQKLAGKYGLDIRLIPMVSGDFSRDYAIQEAVGPREWIGLLHNAQWVVTDSFHCTIFSIIFQKNFATFRAFSDDNKRSQNSRIDSLLEIAGLKDRIVDEDTGVHIDSVTEEQWKHTQLALEQYAGESLQWLMQSIESIKETTV